MSATSDLLAVDIINVVSVTGKAAVDHIDEEDDERTTDNQYWRQALDIRSWELSVSLYPRRIWDSERALTTIPFISPSSIFASATNPPIPTRN